MLTHNPRSCRNVSFSEIGWCQGVKGCIKIIHNASSLQLVTAQNTWKGCMWQQEASFNENWMCWQERKDHRLVINYQKMRWNGAVFQMFCKPLQWSIPFWKAPQLWLHPCISLTSHWRQTRNTLQHCEENEGKQDWCIRGNCYSFAF